VAVKRKNQKKLLSEYNNIRAVKIKCCFCDARENCKYREGKERSENKGILTLCTDSPNISKSKQKQLSIFLKKHPSFTKRFTP